MNRALCCAGVFAVLFVFLSVRISSAEPQAPTNAATQAESLTNPTIRASSHLVLLDVVVTDKSGKPVPGLRAEDFALKENGKPQKISVFTPPSETWPDAPALPAGVYSNAPAYRVHGVAPTVILLDALNTHVQDQTVARGQMLRFLKEQYRPGQSIAVFTLTERLSLVQDFTDSPEVLMSSVEKLNSEESAFSSRNSGSDLAMARMLSGGGRQYSPTVTALAHFQASQMQYETDRRIEITIAAMRCLTRVLGGLPGRKNVIWLTGGFPFSLIPEADNSHHQDLQALMRRSNPELAPRTVDTTQYAERIREVAAQMATSQVAIYPVDLRGLAAYARQDPISNQQTMREIAEETGGRIFINRNDVDNGVALSLRDHAATYTVGYYPQNKNFDRKYRSIDVKLNRADVETTYRRGYFAIDAAQIKDKKPERDVAEMWQDEAADTLVSFEARVDSLEGGKARVEFRVDPSSLSASDDGPNKKFNVGFYIAAFSPEGKMLSSQAMKLDRGFPPDVYQKLQQQGMRLHFDIDEPSGSNELHLAVRDDQTGYVGTLRVPVLSQK